MKIYEPQKLLIAIGLLLALAGCNSNPIQETACVMPTGFDLDQAFRSSKLQLENGCAEHFDRYFTSLLSIASGDPRKENKARFSDLLQWANRSDMISKNQARAYYNRYFGIKYMSLKSDYSVCSEACPKRSRLLLDMRNELKEKELGLAKVSQDVSAYQRANQLYSETEIVLEATCSACAALDQN